VVQLNDLSGHCAENNVKQATAKGFVSGYPDGTFLPDQPVTRAEFTVMISCAMNLQKEQGTLSFTDKERIPSWAQEEVMLTVKAGIIEGYPDGSFRPDNQITRTEMAKMIVSALKLPTDRGLIASFADQDQIPVWAKGFVAVAQQSMLFEGKDNNLFRPLLNATRAEAVTILLRMLNTMN
jgi:hypothetical protein